MPQCDYADIRSILGRFFAFFFSTKLWLSLPNFDLGSYTNGPSKKKKSTIAKQVILGVTKISMFTVFGVST